MNINQIRQKFSQAITYNALFFAFSKGLSTSMTFLLFSKLSTQDFSIWANIYSAIFLMLLWLDFGFRKSIPRYSPEFAKNKACMKKFIRYVVSFQVAVLTVATPFFLIVAIYLTKRLGIVDKIGLFYLGGIMFITEGILSVLRLIYHSHFWQRQFNLQMTAIISIKASAIICFIFYTRNNFFLLRSIFFIEIIAGLIAIVISLIRLQSLYKDKSYPGDQQVNFRKTLHGFIKHSGIMWINNNLKSLTERNFMMLFLTQFLGPYAANLFKIANDGALLFYRTVKKTIGTTDTSLLAHVETLPDRKKVLPTAFKNLIKKISSLCIPLSGILLIVFSHFGHLFKNQFILNTFLLLTTLYLAESILSPYERILEVKQRYIMLAISYTPYIIMVLWLFFGLISSFGLFASLMVIHTFRITSYLIMILFVKYHYNNIAFPIKPFIKGVFFTLLVCLVASILLKAL